MIDRIINKHLHHYLHSHPRWERLKMWHWNRVTYDAGPIFWTLKRVWWIPGLQWLWRLRCANVSWRMHRRTRRLVAKAPDLHTWARG